MPRHRAQRLSLLLPPPCARPRTLAMSLTADQRLFSAPILHAPTTPAPVSAPVCHRLWHIATHLIRPSLHAPLRPSLHARLCTPSRPRHQQCLLLHASSCTRPRTLNIATPLTAHQCLFLRPACPVAQAVSRAHPSANDGVAATAPPLRPTTNACTTLAEPLPFTNDGTVLWPQHCCSVSMPTTSMSAPSTRAVN